MLKIFRNKTDEKPLFLLNFHHQQFDVPTLCETDSGRYVDAWGFTTAILRTPDGAVFNEGTAFCAVMDTFNKAKGRLEALKKATFGMSREGRQIIFTAYVDSGARLG